MANAICRHPGKCWISRKAWAKRGQRIIRHEVTPEGGDIIHTETLPYPNRMIGRERSVSFYLGKAF